MIKFIKYISELYRFHKVTSEHSDGKPSIVQEYGANNSNSAISFNYKEGTSNDKEIEPKIEYNIYGSIFHLKPNGNLKRERINVTVQSLKTAKRVFEKIKCENSQSHIKIDLVNRKLLSTYN